MRIKILILGADTLSLQADSQMLKERGFLVLNTSNIENVNELTSEVKPDVVFFDPIEPNSIVTAACNEFLHDTHFTNIPVILTLSDDDKYSVTPERKDNNEGRKIVTDNIMDAIRIALNGDGTSESKTKVNKRIPFPVNNENRLFA